MIKESHKQNQEELGPPQTEWHPAAVAAWNEILELPEGRLIVLQQEVKQGAADLEKLVNLHGLNFSVENGVLLERMVAGFVSRLGEKIAAKQVTRIPDHKASAIITSADTSHQIIFLIEKSEQGESDWPITHTLVWEVREVIRKSPPRL